MENLPGGQPIERWPANVALVHNPDCQAVCSPGCAADVLGRQAPAARPARFFYQAKPSRSEREAGLADLPTRVSPVFSGGRSLPRANAHPTVKPKELMRWLVRLVVPPGGLVLDPFAGSGSTIAAALLEGRQVIGIERQADYVEIAAARSGYWAEVAASQAKGGAR